MSLDRYIVDAATFEPEAVHALGQAFDETCATLRLASSDHDGRETVAIRIIELASEGLVDAAALRDRVLQEAQVTV